MMASEVQTVTGKRRPQSSEFKSANNHLSEQARQQQTASCSRSAKQDELQEVSGGSGEEGRHHVGPVMGIFFKVWSLVKVSRARHNKMRRQNSEEQFQYVAGDRLNQKQPALLEDRHFRRAGSQPAPTSNQPAEHKLGLVANGRAGNRRTTASKAPAGGSRREEQLEGGWSARRGRSTTNVSRPELASFVARANRFRREQPVVGPEQQVPTSGSAMRLAGNCGGLRRSSEPLSEADNLDADSNDIYSTPNDSIQSVPGGALSGQPSPMIKSFSTSNFAHLLRQQPTGDRQDFGPIAESSRVGSKQELTNCEPEQADARRMSGSRFFISSSSSEDSNSASQQHQQAQTQHQHLETSERQPALVLEQHLPQLPLSLGVHYHAPAITVAERPYQLACVSLFAPAAQTGSPSALTAMSPLDSVPLCPNSPALRGLHLRASQYRKSPSLFEISSNQNQTKQINSSQQSCQNRSGSKFSSKFPIAFQTSRSQLATNFRQTTLQSPMLYSNDVSATSQQSQLIGRQSNLHVPNSISLHDCKLASHNHKQKQQHAQHQSGAHQIKQSQTDLIIPESGDLSQVNSEYKLAEMLLEFGANPSARDELGNTALIHAVLSDNLHAIKCLIERGVDLNEVNSANLSAIDLICTKEPTATRLEMLKLLIDNKVDLDRTREGDQTRLLDRLIWEHKHGSDKLPFIECLLLKGAKLGSSTWNAARGKHEIQLRLLRKLCQDGYFLYKEGSIEASIYRFEYALRRIDELERQLVNGDQCHHPIYQPALDQLASEAARQIKYQTYLGLSRCERKRRFFKRALEFAHLAILVDSTSYEGYYSKAHILKDLGHIDDSLIAIEQTTRIVDKSIESLEGELRDLQQQEDALIFDGCFEMLDSRRSAWIESTRMELSSNLDYMRDAKKYIARLKSDILDDKLRLANGFESTDQRIVISSKISAI